MPEKREKLLKNISDRPLVDGALAFLVSQNCELKDLQYTKNFAMSYNFSSELNGSFAASTLLQVENTIFSVKNKPMILQNTEKLVNHLKTKN